LLDPPRESERLSDWRQRANVVLVDAPCSGSGTWRRNPETRWRLTPARLERLVASQAQLLDVAAELVRPGGHLIYAVCSLLAVEGREQAENFSRRRSAAIPDPSAKTAGRPCGPGQIVTPAHDDTDGFFIARWKVPC
jgi:16S rRNA (cytosine967-C5)-methyltransferase